MDILHTETQSDKIPPLICCFHNHGEGPSVLWIWPQIRQCRSIIFAAIGFFKQVSVDLIRCVLPLLMYDVHVKFGWTHPANKVKSAKNEIGIRKCIPAILSSNWHHLTCLRQALLMWSLNMDLMQWYSRNTCKIQLGESVGAVGGGGYMALGPFMHKVSAWNIGPVMHIMIYQNVVYYMCTCIPTVACKY